MPAPLNSTYFIIFVFLINYEPFRNRTFLFVFISSFFISSGTLKTVSLMKTEWVDGWMETHSWECAYCLYLVQYFEKERDTVINKSNTLGKNIFSHWNPNGILAEDRANFYSCTLTHMFWTAWMASLILKSLYFLWWKDLDTIFLSMKINFPDLTVDNLK